MIEELIYTGILILILLLVAAMPRGGGCHVKNLPKDFVEPNPPKPQTPAYILRGYQPTQSSLTKPPQGGSGVPRK